MQQGKAPQTHNAKEDMETGTHCSLKGCSGARICPGIALFLAGSLGIGIAGYFEVPLLAWLTVVPVFLVLVSGYWQRLFTH